MKTFQGYVLFAIVGLAVGYVLATAYLQWALSNDIGYAYLILNGPSFVLNFPELAGHVGFIIGIPAILGMVFAGMFVTESLTAFGVTDWQSTKQMEKNGFFEPIGGGFLLAKTGKPKSNMPFISSSHYPHCMVIAPTGRGKGVSFVIPNLLAFKGSTVTLDVKGENYDKTAPHRESIGDKVLRFAPTNFEIESVRWNPLDRIVKVDNPQQRMFELQKLANLFLQTESPSAESFLVGGRMAFVAAATLAIERGTATIGAVFDIINGGRAEMNDQFKSYALETKDAEATIMWESLAKNNEKTLTSYISVLNTSGLDAWQNGRVKEVTSESDFDFAEIRAVPHSIYLTVNTHDIMPNAGLIRLFFGDLIATLEHHEPGSDEPWPVMIILDEFHKLGKMPIVAESITTLRSYGARLAIITQTIPKLDEIYGENERRSLEGGAGIKVYMTPSEELTISNLSEACGMTTKRSVSKSRQGGIMRTTSVTEKTEEVPLLKEDDARRLDMSDIILIVDGDHPIKAKGIRYYEDSTLQPLFDAQKGKTVSGPVNFDLRKMQDELKQLKAAQKDHFTKAPEKKPTAKDGDGAQDESGDDGSGPEPAPAASEHQTGDAEPKDPSEVEALRVKLASVERALVEQKTANADTILALSNRVELLLQKPDAHDPLHDSEKGALSIDPVARDKTRKASSQPMVNHYSGNSKA